MLQERHTTLTSKSLPLFWLILYSVNVQGCCYGLGGCGGLGLDSVVFGGVWVELELE